MKVSSVFSDGITVFYRISDLVSLVKTNKQTNKKLWIHFTFFNNLILSSLLKNNF